MAATELPPYVNSTGLVQELFKKIQEAPTPPRFNGDFLFSNLKFKKSGSSIPFIPFLKRIGFIGSDGTPTEIYKKYRNPNPKISGEAMAEAIKFGYSDLYSRNEYWHKLSKEDLKNFLIEKFGVDSKNAALKSLLATIDVLKKNAIFDVQDMTVLETPKAQEEEEEYNDRKRSEPNFQAQEFESINLSYTINLNLPETSDIAVFDSIFKSLKENLLKK